MSCEVCHLKQLPPSLVAGIYRAMSVRVGSTQRTVKSLFKTYIDCLHLKKTDKSRLQADDSLEFDEVSCSNGGISSRFTEYEDSTNYEEKVEKLKELSKQPDVYERLTKSLAPNIWELDDVKKGLLCQDEKSPSFSDPEVSDSDDSGTMSEEDEENLGTRERAKEHVQQLQSLQKKDPEFYQFLREHDKELLDFNDEDFSDEETDGVLEAESEENIEVSEKKVKKSSATIITTAMVDSWCKTIKENNKFSAVRSMMRAFKTACHYGDDMDDESSLRIMSSNVFNKIMLFVLSEYDGILRGLLKLPSFGGKKEIIINLMSTKRWATYGYLVKSYFGNALHVLNQMTDNQMVSFTLRRLRHSAIFLAAFPTLLRKYIKVLLHFWGTGGEALPVVSFLFLRDICIQIGGDSLEMCLKGIYKSYVLNCQFVSPSKLQHIQFLANCVTELYGVDLSSAYQHAFIFIRQLGQILRDALTMKTKESFRKVYEWKFMNCLELWTTVVCAYSSDAEFRPLAYPLTQIISGVARLVPTARYFPLRLRCAKMLNRIAHSTGSFVPVSFLLLDMLDMKELNMRPTGGVGKVVNLQTTLKVSKPTLKTKAFQEACVFSVVEQLAEHLEEWSYSIAFFELAFIPVVRLRSFCKSTKIERFSREIKNLIREVEATAEFTNKRRLNCSLSPNDPCIASFLQVEKDTGVSPLTKYCNTLRMRAQQRNDALEESSVLVGSETSVFGRKRSKDDDVNEDSSGDEKEGVAVFSSSSWLPGTASESGNKKPLVSKKRESKREQTLGFDDDVLEDFVLSSEEDNDMEPVVNPPENRTNYSEKRASKKRKPDSGLKKGELPSTQKPKPGGRKRKGKKTQTNKLR